MFRKNSFLENGNIMKYNKILFLNFTFEDTQGDNQKGSSPTTKYYLDKPKF